MTDTATRPRAAATSHGGRTSAQRLDDLGRLAELADAVCALADAVDASTAAHVREREHLAGEVAAIRATLANVEQTTNATGLTLATAVPKLLDVFGLVTDAADNGVRRTLRARRKATRPTR